MIFNWMLNGKAVSENNGFGITKVGTRTSLLSIESVESRHIGNYTCVVSNRAGISSYSTELLVKGKSQVFILIY